MGIDDCLYGIDSMEAMIHCIVVYLHYPSASIRLEGGGNDVNV